MTGTPAFEGLATLLDGYFHEDFRAEHGSHEGAARAFVRDASPAEREEARTGLAAFIEWAESVSRARWQDALGAAGGSWRPRSLGPLHEVLALLRDGDEG